MRTLISCLFTLFIVNSFSQLGVLEDVVKKLDVNIGSYDNKVVFLSGDIYSREFEFKVFDVNSKKVERTVKFQPKMLSMISTFIFKGPVAYAYYGGAGMMDRVTVMSTGDKLFGMDEPHLVKINFETGEITQDVFSFKDKIYYSSVYPFFNPDSSGFGFYYLLKVSKKISTLKVLQFDLNLKQTDEISFPFYFSKETGDFNENIDRIMDVVCDNEKNVKVFLRHELEKKEKKALGKIYQYKMYEYDHGKKKVDSIEVLGDLKSHRDEINWVWDKNKKDCFIATYLSSEPRDKQTGAHFEKYSGSGKTVVKKDFKFTAELMNKFKEKTSTLPYLSDFRFDGFHITPSGKMYLVGESFADVANFGVYRNDFMFIPDSGDEGGSTGVPGYSKLQSIVSGPLMVFYLNSDLEVDWVNEFDKYLKSSTNGGRPSFVRGQKSMLNGEVLKVFFPDLECNSKMIDGHPFIEKDPNGEGPGTKLGIFQLSINEKGKAEKKLLYSGDKKNEAKDMLSYPVHFTGNKRFFCNFKTIVPVF